MEAFIALDASNRRADLKAAFAAKAAGAIPPDTVGRDGLLELLRAVGLLHAICAEQMTAFVQGAVAADARLAYDPPVEEEPPAFYCVRDAFDRVVALEHGQGLGAREHGARHAAANRLVDAERGVSALLEAVHRDDVAEVTKLLLLGADANFAAADGVTPLFVACERGSAEVVRALSFCGAEPHVEMGALCEGVGETPLSIAAHRGHAACVDELCLSSADPNRRLPSGACALHVAALGGHAAVCDLGMIHM